MLKWWRSQARCAEDVFSGGASDDCCGFIVGCGLDVGGGSGVLGGSLLIVDGNGDSVEDGNAFLALCVLP